MLLYDHIFYREMYSMICQIGRSLSDWPESVTSQNPCIFGGEEDCQDQFQ